MRCQSLSSGSRESWPLIERYLWPSHLGVTRTQWGQGAGVQGPLCRPGEVGRRGAPRKGGPHGPRYSMQLLSVCFRPMMMAICTNRSIMQPLRWHCRRGRDGRSGLGGRPVGDRAAGHPGHTDLLQLPQARQAHGLPRVAVDPGEDSKAEGSTWPLKGRGWRRTEGAVGRPAAGKGRSVRCGRRRPPPRHAACRTHAQEEAQPVPGPGVRSRQGLLAAGFLRSPPRKLHWGCFVSQSPSFHNTIKRTY